jgi:NADH-quinone oxidoreductase subunit K
MFTLASMPTASLNLYLLVAGLLFAIGLTGVVLRRNIIIVFMCLELMLSAANLTLIAFSRFNLETHGLPDIHGPMLVFFVITVAAAEVAVGLAIIVALYRSRQTIHTDELTTLKG